MQIRSGSLCCLTKWMDEDDATEERAVTGSQGMPLHSLKKDGEPFLRPRLGLPYLGPEPLPAPINLNRETR
jgi:hypothetical protein